MPEGHTIITERRMQSDDVLRKDEIGELLGGVFQFAYDPRATKGVGSGFVLDYQDFCHKIMSLPPPTVFQNGFIANFDTAKLAPRSFGAMRGNVEGIAVHPPKSDARDIRDAFIDGSVFGTGFEREGQRTDGEVDGNTPISHPAACKRGDESNDNYALHEWMIT